MKNQILKNNIYIDGNNLYMGARDLNFKIDYKKFYGWLRQKFNNSKVYIFIGFLESKVDFYKYLEQCGFLLIFKETFSIAGKVKGNCDSELVLKVTSDFYIRDFDRCILVTGDGDFGCLVEFLNKSFVLSCILAPNKKKCSFLIKNKYVEVIFLDDQYHKFAEKINEKAPDADASA